MDIFNKEKIADLESELVIYKVRCTQLEREAKSVEDLELKVKCLQMWCDDDEAISELMEAVIKVDGDKRTRFYESAQQAQMNTAKNQFGNGLGMIGAASASGLIGRSW
jgi:hypothetical protein